MTQERREVDFNMFCNHDPSFELILESSILERSLYQKEMKAY